MEDWEDDFPPLLTKEQLKSKWGDEDVDDTDVKESWEDDDEPPQQPVAKKASEEKASKKTAPKGTDKKGKTIEVSKEGPLDPMAKTLRQQMLTLDNFIPKSESDFAEYAELISHKLLLYKQSYHYITLLKAVIRLSVTSLKASDAKDIASSITAITNEKIKAEKQTTSKKKTGNKKKQLHVGKPEDDLIVDAYDDLDEHDFM